MATLATACAVGFLALPARASVLIQIDKSTQRMTVSQDGAVLYTWPVSSGLRRYDTPAGSFSPFRMEKDHFSREWDDAPMPYSIFFTQRGHAIHGTEHRRNIGRPASHGCVRLETENARTLFALVKREGMANTRVVLSGETPGASDAPAMARRAPAQVAPVNVAPAHVSPGYGPPGYVAPDRDDDFTGSIPRRERVYQRAERPDYYWGLRPDYTARVYGDRERYYQPPPRAPYGRVFGD